MIYTQTHCKMADVVGEATAVENTYSATLRKICEENDRVDDLIQQLHAFTGTTSAYKTLDVKSIQAMSKLRSVITNAKHKSELDSDVNNFSATFRDKLIGHEKACERSVSGG